MEIRTLKLNKLDSNSEEKYFYKGHLLSPKDIAIKYFDIDSYNLCTNVDELWKYLIVIIYWDVIFPKSNRVTELAKNFKSTKNFKDVKFYTMDKSFYFNRKKLITNKLEKLKTKNIYEKFIKNYYKYGGVDCSLIEN